MPSQLSTIYSISKNFILILLLTSQKVLNVSIMRLRSYVDEEVMSVLSEYGELKSKVIRLK